MPPSCKILLMSRIEQIEQIEILLRRAGCRSSKLREAMLKILIKGKPTTVKDILHNLQGFGFWPNKTTVYRELETLEKNKLITCIDLGGDHKFYKTYGDGKQQHLVCKKCFKVKSIQPTWNWQTIVEDYKHIPDFVVEESQLLLRGLCLECSTIK